MFSERNIRILFIFLGAFTLFIFFWHFHLVGFGVNGDGIGYYSQLRSFFFDGNLRVDDEYGYFSGTYSRFSGGRRYVGPIFRYSTYPSGLAVVLSPFFALGHGLALVLHKIGFPVAPDGLSLPYDLLYCTGNVVLGLWGLMFCYKGARTYFDAPCAALATIGVWFCTPVFYYLTIEPSMSHAASLFFVSGFLYFVSLPWMETRRLQVLAGLFLGFAVIVRPQDGLFAVVPFLQGLARLHQGKRVKDVLSPLCTVGAICTVFVLFQAMIYILESGSVLKIYYFTEPAGMRREGAFDWLHPQIYKVLFSGFHGLFSWHPLAMAGVAGLMLYALKKGSVAVPLLLAFLLQLYLVSSWWAWWQGSSFGGRMFINCSYPFTIGLAYLLYVLNVSKRLKAGLFLIAFFSLWNALLALQYLTRMMPEGETPVIQILVNQMRVIPHAIKYIMSLKGL